MDGTRNGQAKLRANFSHFLMKQPIPTIVAEIVALALLCAPAIAQDQADKAPPASPEQTALTEREHEFEAAYAKGDAAALADFFTDDAEYTDSDGDLTAGRAAIEKDFRESLAANKGSKLDIVVTSVKTLTPDVVIEKGQTTITKKDGSTDESLFTAVQVRKDGKWRICQLTETEPTATPHDQLSDLEWLVGSWTESDEGNISVKSTYDWARGGNFLTQNVTVKKKDDTVLEGWQIIGWDNAQNRVRSWIFDTEGGFSEAVWTQDGDRWLMREIGVTADGDRTTADNMITKLGNDRYAWESNNRTLDGEPQPSIGRIEISRAKGN